MAIYEAGSGPAVILLHGFPELAYSWRHQIRDLSAKGWRVIAPDLRGYGSTGPHGGTVAYSMCNLSADVIGLLDALQVDRTVLVGHDFGSMLAWAMARDHPDRVRGVVSLATPYTRRSPEDLARVMLEHRGESNYMVQFQTPGVGEALLERDVEATFRGLMRRPGLRSEAFRKADARIRALPMTLFVGGELAALGEPILTDEDLKIYVSAYRRNGFTGPLNWYRNFHQNWLDTEGVADRVEIPALMVSAEDDFFLPPDTTSGMEHIVPDLERRLIRDCGHWIQQEQPQQTSGIIVEWLERRMRGPSFGFLG
jgi:pimeloyl-ACP methyl ester carboxylesterase